MIVRSSLSIIPIVSISLNATGYLLRSLYPSYRCFGFHRSYFATKSSIDEPSVTLVPSLLANHIQSISLKNWGVFEDASVELSPTLGFIALSGETGSGKSIFLYALQYCTGETSCVKVRSCGAKEDSSCSVSLDLITRDPDCSKDASIRSFRRSYLGSNKKSSCEIDGQKALMRDLQQTAGKSFRFWSTDAIEKLDNEGFMNYVDRFVGSSLTTLLDDVSTSYTIWKKEREHLMYLRKMEHKAEDEEEVGLMNDYNEELTKFYTKFDGLEKSIISWLQSMQIDHSGDTGKSSSTELALIQALVSPQQKQENWRWEDFISCEDYFRKYTKQMSELNPSKANTMTNSLDGVKKTLSNMANSAIPPADFKTTERFLDTKLRDVEQLLSIMTELGVLSDKASDRLSELQSMLHEAVASLQVIAKSVSDLKSFFPDVPIILQKLASLRSEWETLARKHGTTPSGLRDKYLTIQAELRAIQDVWSLLPNQIKREQAAFDEYALTASELSQQRSKSAGLLQERVNNLLPSLDMGDKRLKIEVISYEPESSIDSRGICGGLGWDRVQVSLILSPHSSISSIDEQQSSRISSSAFATTTPTSHEDSSLRSILSSGEAARLALVLETLSDQTPLVCIDNNKQQAQLPILILDEIDAHIGGDAAVAVAKLLKKQSKRRQVLVVTHNPVIAAAADCHLIVRRVRNSYNAVINEMQQSSEIKVLTTNEEREVELSRMATGRLNITAGMDLAKALLSTNFSS